MKLNFTPLCYDIKGALKNLVDIMSELNTVSQSGYVVSTGSG